MEIINTSITKLTAIFRPGRNIAVIIEVAAKNHRFKKMVVNAAEDFAKRLNDIIEQY